MFEPLLEAAFPSSPPVPSNMKDSSKATSKDAQADLQPRFELPTISIQSSPGSLYSSTSPPPSPPLLSPCSPRPGHAQLPAPSLNFANVPLLSPSILGPRGSPPRPLRTSIQKLRRMNSDADEKGGKAERRYLRLGREESIALPGEETWLDELDEEEYDGGLDEEKGRHLVGDILDDWEEEATVLQLDIEYTKTDKGKDNSNNNTPTQGQVPSSPSASRRSSSIWENGERFWQSTPPHPPTSPNKPKQHFLPLCSSPVSTPTPKSNRKRHFEVAKDASLPISPNEDTNDNSNSSSNSKKASERTSRDERRRSVTGSRYRKRSALGVSTPNVRIQVQPPSGGFQGTPGSLYDADGFLQV
ncbi:hypothetical protein BDV95DRAFT_573756 [Massariosphaeria phaeospora]|uniref:Uncharacterized protein n=1 Tax=Massariosphaeria phaeospora TaxID=100035 RepID=A0A7C8M9G9_9PLEO|nr:hypothetical protein BDV95DRAFT_573756 [Massariosphaeria phaeospora]